MELYTNYMHQLKPYVGNTITWSNDLNKIGLYLFGSKRFLGVFTSDLIPKMTNNTYAILNLDTSMEPGSHWIAVAKTKRNILIVYDSFGRSYKAIINQLKTHFEHIKNTELDAEQAPHETNCGLRCMAWLCVFHYHGETIALKI